MFKHIIVPLDGSTFADKAMPVARELALNFGSRITLVAIFTMPGLNPAAYQRRVEQIEDYLSDYEADLRAAGLVVERAVMDGDPADRILTIADSRSADLIVMTTHGRSGTLRWRMGSVADRVVRNARIPVLLIRPPDGDDGTTKLKEINVVRV